MFARRVSRDSAVRTEQHAAEANLTNASRDQLTLLLPIADPGDSGNVKENVCHPLVVFGDGVYKDTERLVDGWVIVTAGAREMGDLHRNVRHGRQNAAQK